MGPFAGFAGGQRFQPRKPACSVRCGSNVQRILIDHHDDERLTPMRRGVPLLPANEEGIAP